MFLNEGILESLGTLKPHTGQEKPAVTASLEGQKRRLLQLWTNSLGFRV